MIANASLLLFAGVSIASIARRCQYDNNAEDLFTHYSGTGEQGCRFGNENIIRFVKLIMLVREGLIEADVG